MAFPTSSYLRVVDHRLPDHVGIPHVLHLAVHSVLLGQMGRGDHSETYSLLHFSLLHFLTPSPFSLYSLAILGEDTEILHLLDWKYPFKTHRNFIF